MTNDPLGLGDGLMFPKLAREGKQVVRHTSNRVPRRIATYSPSKYSHGASHISLAFPANKSDESSCAKNAQKRMNRTHMTHSETIDKAAAAAQPGAPHRPTAAKSKTRTAPPAKQAKTSKKAVKQVRATKRTAPQATSKSTTILDLIRRAKGATLSEIMKATEWQAHSVRGFLSVAAKKHQLKIESAKNQAGDRVYRVVK